MPRVIQSLLSIVFATVVFSVSPGSVMADQPAKKKKPKPECYITRVPLVNSQRVTLIKKNCTQRELAKLIDKMRKKEVFNVQGFEWHAEHKNRIMSFDMRGVLFWEAVARISNQSGTGVEYGRSAETKLPWDILEPSIHHWCLIGPMLAHVRFEQDPFGKENSDEKGQYVALRFPYVQEEAHMADMDIDNVNLIFKDGIKFKLKQLRRSGDGTWYGQLPFEDTSQIVSVTGNILAKVGREYYHVYIRPGAKVENTILEMQCEAEPIRERKDKKGKTLYSSWIRVKWSTGLTEEEQRFMKPIAISYLRFHPVDEITSMKKIAQKRRLLQLASQTQSYIVGEREFGRPKSSPIKAAKTGFGKAELLLQSDNKKDIDTLHKVVLVRMGYIHEDFKIPIRKK